jgi:hypothetical protein
MYQSSFDPVVATLSATVLKRNFNAFVKIIALMK